MEQQSNSDYLKVLEIEQSFIKLRWSIVTFFITVSFAIFSFAMQGKIIGVPLSLQQVLAILVYWFAFLIHITMHTYTDFLRDYLKKMEDKNETTLKLRSEANEYLAKNSFISITKLLVLLGIIYTLIILSSTLLL